MSAVRPRGYRYSRGIMGLPSLLVALSWAAVWLLWTPTAGTRLVERPPAATRTVFSEPDPADFAAMDPRDIIRLQRRADEMDAPSSAVISHYAAGPSYLQRGPLGTKREDDLPYRSALCPEPGPQKYRPNWREKAVFRPPSPVEPRLVIQCSGELRKYGFHLQELVSRMLALGKAPRQVAVHVKTDENGRVEHVFLDESSGDAQVDQRVLKAIYRGRLVTKGARCSGSVTVSFPGE